MAFPLIRISHSSALSLANHLAVLRSLVLAKIWHTNLLLHQQQKPNRTPHTHLEKHMHYRKNRYFSTLQNSNRLAFITELV